MADAVDPDAAPTHHDVRERYSPVHAAIAAALGITATVVGIVLGVVLVNN
ncbi:MAG: hypothetical protein ACKVT1_11615 [Dehalococcoidia bacterium]